MVPVFKRTLQMLYDLEFKTRLEFVIKCGKMR